MKQVFSYAFRPLFFLATLYGIAGIGWWGLAWSGHLPLPALGGNPVWWHAHEMIFGFAAAGIGGFALTAVANWTRRPPVAGLPLMVLCGFWLIARLQGLAGGTALLPMAVSDLGYDLLLCGLMAREVIAGNSQRNYKLIVLLALFTLANALFYLAPTPEWSQRALWAGLWLVVLLLNLIGGRIIPAFTGNWLVAQARKGQLAEPQRPPGFGRPDLVATVATVAFALAFLVQPVALPTALIGAVAAACQLLRWWRWQFYRTLTDPMMWILHLGFLWLVIGLALLCLGSAGLLPLSSGVHALMTGAASTMILAVASRAALGHSNRPLANHPLLTASYLGITLTALLRIIASVSPAPAWMALATVAWVISLSLFAWRYTPILLGPPASDVG